MRTAHLACYLDKSTPQASRFVYSLSVLVSLNLSVLCGCSAVLDVGGPPALDQTLSERPLDEGLLDEGLLDEGLLDEGIADAALSDMEYLDEGPNAGIEAGIEAGVEAGIEVDQGPTGGEPPSIESALTPHLPSPGCVVWEEGVGCLAHLQIEDETRCEAYEAARHGAPSVRVIGELRGCALGAPREDELSSVTSLLSLMRSLNRLPPFEVTTEESLNACALAHRYEADPGWSEGAPCFTPELQNALILRGQSIRQRGRWSPFEAIRYLLSGSRISEFNPVYGRHLLLSPALSALRVGQHEHSSCLNAQRNNTEAAQAHPLPFTLYPGLGHVPFELLNAGNHRGVAPLWSVSFESSVSDLEVTLYNLNTQQNIELSPLSLEVRAGLQLVSWKPLTPLSEGDQLRLSLSFLGSAREPRHIDVYLHLQGCGFTEPERCDVTGPERCLSMQHCAYESAEPSGWVCAPTGPLGEDVSCSGLSGGCSKARLCVQEPTRFPEGVCAVYCDPELGGARSCEDRCAPPLTTATLELEGEQIGVCLP